MLTLELRAILNLKPHALSISPDGMAEEFASTLPKIGDSRIDARDNRSSGNLQH